MKQNDELDRRLDQALAEYRDAEPLTGMEDRILRRVTAQPAPRSRRMGWAFAWTAAAALIVIAVWFGVRKLERPRNAENHAKPATQQTIANAPQVEKPVTPSARREARPTTSARLSRPAAASHVAAMAGMKPKPAQFPTPAPLTSEEHALLALANTHPDVLLKQPADDVLLKQPADSDQLSIAPIEIKPLAPEAGAQQGEPQ